MCRISSWRFTSPPWLERRVFVASSWRALILCPTVRTDIAGIVVMCVSTYPCARHDDLERYRLSSMPLYPPVIFLIPSAASRIPVIVNGPGPRRILLWIGGVEAGLKRQVFMRLRRGHLPPTTVANIVFLANDRICERRDHSITLVSSPKNLHSMTTLRLHLCSPEASPPGDRLMGMLRERNLLCAVISSVSISSIH
jgi:hypothetical protein